MRWSSRAGNRDLDGRPQHSRRRPRKWHMNQERTRRPASPSMVRTPLRSAATAAVLSFLSLVMPRSKNLFQFLGVGVVGALFLFPLLAPSTHASSHDCQGTQDWDCKVPDPPPNCVFEDGTPCTAGAHCYEWYYSNLNSRYVCDRTADVNVGVGGYILDDGSISSSVGSPSLMVALLASALLLALVRRRR